MKFLFNNTILRNEGGEGGEGNGGGGGLMDGGGSEPSEPTSTEPSSTGGEYSFSNLIGDNGEFVPDFADKLPDNLKDKASHFQKFKTPEQIMESNYNLQQLLGKKSEAVVIPNHDAPPEVINEFRAKMGIPNDPSGYELKVPEEVPEGVTINPEEMDQFKGFAHELGLTPEQAQKLVEFDIERYGQQATEIQQSVEEQQQAQLQQESKALKEKWGGEFDKNMVSAEKGAKMLGYTKEDMKSNPLFSSHEFVDVMNRVGKMFSEDKIGGGENITASTNKSQASDIINNPSNPYHQRYWKGEQEVVDLVSNLMQK